MTNCRFENRPTVASGVFTAALFDKDGCVYDSRFSSVFLFSFPSPPDVFPFSLTVHTRTQGSFTFDSLFLGAIRIQLAPLPLFVDCTYSRRYIIFS